MIPRAHITAWRAKAPWPTDAQVEQDLVLSKALVDMFNQPAVAESLVFRGGTAIHKLFISPARRYSEDIDLVQVSAGPIGSQLNGIRIVLDPWLGEPSWKQGHARVVLVYRFKTSTKPELRMRLKIEIHTREHYSVFGFIKQPYYISNPWFSGEADIQCYELDELLGTKLRALYQRKKGRDLFDLWLGVRHGDVDSQRIVDCFERYMIHENASVSRAEFEANLADKMNDEAFLEDILPLLPSDQTYDPYEAEAVVKAELISRLPGAPWKGTI